MVDGFTSRGGMNEYPEVERIEIVQYNSSYS